MIHKPKLEKLPKLIFILFKLKPFQNIFKILEIGLKLYIIPFKQVNLYLKTFTYTISSVFLRKLINKAYL